MHELNINPDHIQAHPAILTAYEDAKKTGATLEARGADVAAEQQRCNGLFQKIAVLQLEIEQSRTKSVQLLAQLDVADTARSDVGKLERWFGELFGASNAKPIDGKGADLPRALIDTPGLREGLGIVQVGLSGGGRFATPEDLAAKAEAERDGMCLLKKQCAADELRLQDLTRRCNFAEAEMQQQKDAGHVAEDVREAVKELTFEIEQVSENLKRRLAHIEEAAACN